MRVEKLSAGDAALNADVVVVGGGGAGLACAVTAAERGAKVIVLEKRNCVGGNAALASGLFAAESPVQKRAMVDASRDKLFSTMMEWTHWNVDPRIIRTYIDRSGDTIRWLEELGCRFELMPFFPNQTPLVVHRQLRRAAVTDALRQRCEELGVTILVRTAAEELLLGEHGRVVGVVAVRSGRQFSVAAERVVISTGGYGGNRELIRKHASNYHDGMRCIGLPNMGDGLRLATGAGAATEGLGMLQIEGPCAPRPLRLMIDAGDSAQIPLMLWQVAIEPYALWLNKKGERFIDEVIGHSPFVAANGVVRQPDGVCYGVLDTDMVRTMSETGLLLPRGPASSLLGSALPGLERELRRQAEMGVLYYSKVDPDLCNGCGVCVASCPLDLIRLDTVAADRGECTACRSGCPAGVDMRRYVYLLRQGQPLEALDLVREENPFPAVTGRVCPHTCESECARREVDEAVSINSIERFLGDFGLQQDVEETPRIRSERVAIIGSGPAGLSCAYFLARWGYAVTVFEALPVLGGMLRTGIPEYRLPKTVVEAQVGQLRDMGVAFVSGVAIGKDIPFEEVTKDHQAVFLALGNGQSRRIPLEGSEREGVLWGLDFLRAVSLKTGVEVGEKVVVIGGGNVAIDVALTARRLGARQVVMACLETGEAVPAYPEEIDQALAEGVEIHEGWGPLRVVPAESGVVAGIELGRCLALCDETGRFSPCLDPGDKKFVPADSVILAVGQAPDRSFAPPGLSVTGSGTMEADPLTGETSLPGVFAGGDIVSGPSTVVKAIAAGKRAAVSIERYLRGEDLRQGRDLVPERVKSPPKEGIPMRARQKSPLLSVEERAGNFREVALGFDAEMAHWESTRCMTCGSRAVINRTEEECRLCQACERNCPQRAAAILPAGTTDPYVRIADSWEEIAAWIGAAPAALETTVAEYNATCDRGYDPIFAKERHHLLPLRTPPYYAIKLGADYLATIGGIKVNERMEVLDTRGNAIPGLYAAGIDTGGWVGNTYCLHLTGTTFAFSINSGRIAAESALGVNAR